MAMFGSMARGTATETNDVDLYIGNASQSHPACKIRKLFGGIAWEIRGFSKIFKILESGFNKKKLKKMESPYFDDFRIIETLKRLKESCEYIIL